MNYEELINEWTERLGLGDWVISFHPCCKPEDMSEEAVGCSTWQESTKSARIEIVDPHFYENRVREFDWEKTLVHELLHLKMSFISSECDPLQERIAHQLIDDLARAFVDAKRWEGK